MLLRKKDQPLLSAVLFIGMIFCSCSLRAEAVSEQAIQAPVKALHATLLDIMQTVATKNFQERYDIMEATVVEHFNFTLIAKVVLGRYWKTLDDTSRTDFISLFKRLTIATYVDRFDSFNGEHFNNLAIEKMKKNRFMVKTEFIKTNHSPVSFNYIVQNDDAKWQIVSIIANGINDLALKRADYAAVIKNHGFATLTTRLEEKINAVHKNAINNN